MGKLYEEPDLRLAQVAEHFTHDSISKFLFPCNTDHYQFI